MNLLDLRLFCSSDHGQPLQFFKANIQILRYIIIVISGFYKGKKTCQNINYERKEGKKDQKARTEKLKDRKEYILNFK